MVAKLSQLMPFDSKVRCENVAAQSKIKRAFANVTLTDRIHYWCVLGLSVTFIWPYFALFGPYLVLCGQGWIHNLTIHNLEPQKTSTPKKRGPNMVEYHLTTSSSISVSDSAWVIHGLYWIIHGWSMGDPWAVHWKLHNTLYDLELSFC